MTNYAELIDAETWAFIARTNAHYPPDTTELTVAEQRAIYDRMCREFHAGHPEGMRTETTAVATATHAIPIRIYRTSPLGPPAVVLYFHGGGFMLGGLDSHDDVCAEICQRTGYEVVSVDYRLAPEHIHPAAFDDAMTAFEWLAARDDRPVLLCGDSAGGNLAAAVAHAARGGVRRAAGQVLIYPALGGDMARGSYVEHADAPMLSARDLAFYGRLRTGDRELPGDATLAPLQDRDFSELPATFAVTAQCDPLSSDGEAYRDRIVAAGGHAVWVEELGLVHGYLRARHTVSRARESFSRIVDALTSLGRGGALPD
jgi:acetyl esterase